MTLPIDDVPTSGAAASAIPSEKQFVADDVYDRLLAEPDAGPLKTLTELGAAGEDPEDGDPGAEPVAPAVTAQPTPAAVPEPPPTATPPAVAPAPAEDDVMARIEDTLARLNERMPEKPAPPAAAPPAAPEVPAHLKSLLEHDDPLVRESGQALLAEHRALNSRLDNLESGFNADLTSRVAETVQHHIDQVRARHPWLTDGMVDAVGDYLANVPGENGLPLASSLTFEKAVERLYPDRMTPTKGAAPTTPPAEEGRTVIEVPQPGAGTATATVDGRGGAAGATPTVRSTRQFNSIEEALDEGAVATGLLPRAPKRN